MPPPLAEGYPPQYESRLMLKNGREVLLRPILPTDGPLLVDLFKRMSAQSLFLRFLRPMPALPDTLLYRFTHVNYESEFALVAVSNEEGHDALIAVGRYAQEYPGGLADLALAVRDDWQQVGLGKALLKTLIEIGKAHGLVRFGSMMDPRNQRMQHLLVELGYEVKYSVQSGFFQVEILV